ncbi:MAG: glycoside hydrolase family 92 protein [Bacteroidetes bacterium]|nr:glycoside hydrolase family 92 protein [Bacteroidota bacterium]
MKKLLLLLPLSFFLFTCSENETPGYVCFPWKVDTVKTDFAKYVDPMIGTAGHGHTFPGACAPFGMVQLSPDTRVDGSWDGCSGYHYDDSVIYGFSHTHLSGTGCSDYGDILFMPGSGKINYTNGADGKPGYRTKFFHINERAEAGYYFISLPQYKINVELTASPRVGVQRYQFYKNDSSWVLLDLQHRDEVIGSHLEIVNDSIIRGYRFSRNWANDQRVYFYAKFSVPFKKSSLWSNGKIFEADSSSAKDLKAVFQFDCNTKDVHHGEVIVKVALSPVSCENAKLNMETEVPDFDFDAVRKKVQQQWNSELGKIEVKDSSNTKKRIFYTALYHCFISPNLYSDVNGDYWGMDKKVHRDSLHPQYTVFSLWDTYRALHPLFTIIQPERDQDFIRTFLKQFQDGGKLPVWELSANETNCMIGYHSVPVIVDAWMKGLTDFDTALAYEAMKVSAMSDDNGLKAYKKYGFIPAEGESESVSKTLEYAYDDWCIALAAKRMKNDADYKYFSHRSMSWRNLFDPQTGFMRARLNNSFSSPFDPNEVNFHYTEANAWQYSLAVQQDIPGLIAAHGGDKKFIEFLDKLFSTSSATSGRDQADISGMIGQYAQGNEPSHHMAYLYDYTSEPWKTQKIVSKICNEQYTDKPDGLCGNEDCGQMSAWYVMSMMGMYDVSPGTSDYSITEPGFDHVVLHLESGKDFEINDLTKDTDQLKLPEGFKAGYLFADLNGKKIHKNEIAFNEIAKGGKFALIRIGTNWQEVNVCSDQAAIPLPPRIEMTDFYETNNLFFGPNIKRTFTDVMHLFYYEVPGVKIFQSINGNAFAETTWKFDIKETSAIKAFTVNEIGQHSDTVDFKYTKIPGGRSIKLNTQYENQYTGGGDDALIDGIMGSDNFRTGEWQGYEGKDLDAVIDLGSVKDVSRISLGCLQDQGAWIFMPSEIKFYASSDGKNFTIIDSVANNIDPKRDGTIRNQFLSVKKTKARYIKVVAKNIGTCPQWHPGKGSPAWIFADEIEIE